MSKALDQRKRKGDFALKLFQAHAALEGRLGRRVTQAEVAKAVGVDQTTVGSWFPPRGTPPRLAHQRALCAFYGVSGGWLFFDEEPVTAQAS